MGNPKGCWRECTAAALAIFCCLGLNINVFSVFVPYLSEDLQLSHTQSSNFLMIRSLVSVAGVFFARYYYEKLEIRLGCTLALVLSAVSAFMYVGAKSFSGLCIAAAVSGFAYGLGGMYPASVLIHRWFRVHEGLAMGICAASSGLAITVGAPIFTVLIETFSVQFTMYCEIGFLLVCAAVCFLLIRDYPQGVQPDKPQHREKRKRVRLDRMFFAMVAVGVVGGAFSFLTIHYTTEGFGPYQISTIVSVVGFVLIAAKFMMGELFDLWGAYRTNWLFLSAAVVSCMILSLGGAAGYGPALIGAVLYGFGNTAGTVGVSAYARDMSTPEEYTAVQQQYQTAGLLGNVICSSIPGLIANATGNYRAFYLIIAALGVFATVVIQSTYAKRNRPVKNEQ